MTPLQIIKLMQQVREMQKKRVSELRHNHKITAHYDALRELEAELDRALEPYILYIQAAEYDDQNSA